MLSILAHIFIISFLVPFHEWHSTLIESSPFNKLVLPRVSFLPLWQQGMKWEVSNKKSVLITVLEARSLKLRFQHRCAHSEGPRMESFLSLPAFSDCRHSLACGHMAPISDCGHTASPVCLPKLPLLLSYKNACEGVQIIQDDGISRYFILLHMQRPFFVSEVIF